MMYRTGLHKQPGTAMHFINQKNAPREIEDGTVVPSRIGGYRMSSVVLNGNSVKQQLDNKNGTKSAAAGLLEQERRPAMRIMGSPEENDLPDYESIAPDQADSAPFQRSHLALQLLYDACVYAQQLDRVYWDFAEEIDSLRQHGLTNGDLRWLVCNGFVEHGREITQRGQEGRKFHRDSGLYFSSETCFVLTEQGASYASRCLNAPVDDSDNDPNESRIPVWDRDRQELRVGLAIVKQFKVPARNQETILAAFQEEDWPVFIDDPLPMHPEIDPKRRLHDTINSLNRNQKSDVIRFRGNGSGQGIRWELVQPSESSD
jgi:hypothetical protein